MFVQLKQKHAEVAGDIQQVQDGVQWAWNQSTLQCQKDLLKDLGHRIENDLAIVNKLVNKIQVIHMNVN